MHQLAVWRVSILARHAVAPVTAGLPSSYGRPIAARRIGEECQLRPLGRDRFDHLIGEESEFIGTYRVSVSLSKNLDGAVRQCRSKFGRGVPRTAIVPTTGSQKGSTPKPGIASRTSPGKSSHCRPSTMNSSSAVPISTTHTIGGKGVAKAPMASEMPAMAKARASRFLENLRVFEIGVPGLLGSVGGGVIWVWSAVIGNSFVTGRRPPH